MVEGLPASLGLSWQHGRLVTLSIGSHQPLAFSHNPQGFEQQRSNGQGFALRHEWTPTGLLTRQKLETDAGQVSDTLERRYQYDALDRLTGISDSHWGDQAFRLNGTGQITAERRDKNRERQARLFGYDSEQNLCDVAYVAPGATRQDATTETAQYDVAGRIIRRGDSWYQYDDCGRLVMKRRTPAGFRPQETRYKWNVHDRLVRIQLPDGARWRYRYDPFKPDGNGYSPLMLAVRYASLPVVHTLLKHADASQLLSFISNDGSTVLHAVCLREDRTTAEKLFRILEIKFAPAWKTNEHGITPLHYAAWKGHVGIVDGCCKRGVDVNTADTSGNTALHTAIMFDTGATSEADVLSIVTTLITAGADPSAVNAQGETALSLAAQRNLPSVTAFIARITTALPPHHTTTLLS